MLPDRARDSLGAVNGDLETAVEHILASPAFQRSHRLSQLLRYLAQHTASGDVEALKESFIGQRVFGRPPNYSAAEDNIARSSIRQLRLKLDEYYAGLGSTDPWLVTLPKGSYSIGLERRAAPETEPPSADEPTPGTDAISVRRLFSGRGLGRGFTIGALCGAVIALAIVTALRGGSSAPSSVRANPGCLLGLLSAKAGQRMLVVVPDADVQLYQRLTGHTVSLQDYIGRKFTHPEALAQAAPALAGSSDALFRHETTQSFVLDLIPKFAEVVPPVQLSVRHPGSLDMVDFQNDNALLISGPYGDPWVQLFDGNLNFQIKADSTGHAHIADRAPAGSERATYYNFTDSSHTVCYARIAYLPGLTSASRILLAGGPHTASTDAACRFLTRPDSVPTVCRLFGVKSASQLPWFELLVEARALGNAPWSMQVIAHRIVPGR